MRIDTTQSIASVPILKIRDLFRRDDRFNIEQLKQTFKLTTELSEQLLAELQAEGFIIKKRGKYHTHVLTDKGRALSVAKGLKALNRDKGWIIIDKLIQTVQEINSDDYYLHKVTDVVLFGSMLKDVQVVNDIDVAVEITRKEEDVEKAHILRHERIAQIRAAGKRFRNIVEELCYPEYEVWQKLKKVSRYLSFHTFSDGILDNAEKKQLFGGT